MEICETNVLMNVNVKPPVINSRINWLTSSSVDSGAISLPVCDNFRKSATSFTPVRKDSSLKKMAKTILWPLKKLHDDLLVDGFVEREMGRLIRKHGKSEDVFLDIGCGDMALCRFLPEGSFLNALDVGFSEFHLNRHVKKKKPKKPKKD